MSIFTKTFFASVLAATVQMASAQTTITTTTAGTLRSLVGEDNLYTTTNLVVSGPLNGADILTLRRMAGADSLASGSTTGTLATLDLSGATIEAGGNYYRANASVANSIGAYAFTKCTSLTSITLPTSVTSIGNYAFQQSGLTSITIPEGITSIGNSAFANNSLTTVNIPASVTSLGTYAFTNSSTLSSVTFSSGSALTSIPNGAFNYCSALTSVSLPDGITSIGNSAFASTALTSFTFPSSLTSIGNLVFQSDTLLTSFSELPASLTSIGTSAFQGTQPASISLASGNSAYTLVDGVLYNTAQNELVWYPAGASTTSFTVPATVDSVLPSAFFAARNITSLTIEEGVLSLGAASFRETSISTLTIPQSVTAIGGSAFYACALTEVTFAGSPTIAALGFANNSSLAKLTFESTTPPTTRNGIFNNSAETIYAYVPSGTESAYTAALITIATTNKTLVINETTAINSAATESTDLTEVSRYDVSGRQISAPTRGINVVKYSDGSVRKVVVQ